LARIKTEDLPVQCGLTAAEMEEIVGAGRFVPRIEELEARRMMSATYCSATASAKPGVRLDATKQPNRSK
jgi:hypothetical protein